MLRAESRRRPRSRTPASSCRCARDAVALPLYPLLAPDTPFVAFALFMGVAMSITAFPVLARILIERADARPPARRARARVRGLRRRHRLVPDRARDGCGDPRLGGEAVPHAGLAGAFCIVMALVVRPLLARLRRPTTRPDASRTVARGDLRGVLLSAYVTEQIGIARDLRRVRVGWPCPGTPSCA